MPIIDQYRPAFFTGFENAKVEFKTKDELLNIEWVKAFAETPRFHQFSVSRYDHGQHVLMAEYREGKEWWVVGYLDDPVKDLPAFDPEKK